MPGPKLWCPKGCGTRVDNSGAPGHEGAVLVLLGIEPFWFCGVACAVCGIRVQLRVLDADRRSATARVRYRVSQQIGESALHVE